MCQIAEKSSLRRSLPRIASKILEKQPETGVALRCFSFPEQSQNAARKLMFQKSNARPPSRFFLLAQYFGEE